MIVPALIARTQTIIEMTSPLNPLISRPVKAANARKRIIPAGAGNSMKPVMSNPVIRDHPRRRGELTWIPLGSMYLIVVKRFTLDNNRESLV